MKRIVQLLVILLVLAAGWFCLWYSLMADHVTQVEATIAYQNQQFKSATPNMVLKAEKVYATGFPFRMLVAIKRLSWSMVEGKETYLITTDMIEAEPMGGGEYRLHPTDQYDALYAKDGAAPEHYHVTISDAPEVILRAADDKPDTPMTEYKAFLPSVMGATMELNGKSSRANFPLSQTDFMNYQPIQKNVERPLWLFLGVLREALVFNTPASDVPYQ